MNPLLAWFVGQAVGPELVAEGMRRLANRDVQTALAKEVVGVVDGRVSWRVLRRFLRRPDIWPDLVEPSSAGAERLVAGVEHMLRRTRRWRATDGNSRRSSPHAGHEHVLTHRKYLTGAAAPQSVQDVS